jgi:hypothetical protein
MLKRIAVLALLSISLASAKTYTFSVSEPAQAGQAQLKPGEYSLKVDGSQVLLMDKSGRPINATPKIEVADRKFDQTAISISKANGTNRIQWIELGGSKHKVVFE